MTAAAISLLGACATDEELADEGAEGLEVSEAISCDAGPAPVRDAGPTDPGHGETGIPCAVQEIVEKKCATCHAAEPQGAPFSLASLADWQGQSLFDPSKKMAAVANERVNATAANRRMPPTSAPQLTDAEKKVVSDWLAGGAKAGAACGGHSVPDAGPKPDQGFEPATSGKAHNKPIKYDDPELKCYEFRGYASPSNKKGKYSVPNGASGRDLYVAFNIKAPWTGTQYIKSFRSLIDNGKVLHHWLLFRQLNGGVESVTPRAAGVHPDGEMLYGWAPGGDDMWFDPDVGMEVSGGQLMQLETHYNNAGSAPAPDASGVEVCVSPKRPAHIATLSWVGTDAINGRSAVGQCNHTSRSDIHLIASQPHMHMKGIHMKAELTRRAGGKEVIHDKPFDFNFQRAYIHDVVIKPGDRITTTCTYNAPARFGKGTNDEMCYFFSIAWPGGALKAGGIGPILHGPNTCMQ